MKTALIGYGYWGRILEKYLEESSDFNLAFIYSPSMSPRGKYTNNFEEIFENNELECAVIASPTHHHFENAKSLIERGVHILCEKPAVKSMEQFETLQKMCSESGAIFETNYIWTHSPGINLIKAKLPSIGPIKRVELELSQLGRFYDQDDVFEVLGSHLLSIVAYLWEKDRIENISYIPHIEIDNNIVKGDAILEFTGMSIELRTSLVTPRKTRQFKFFGDKGTLYYEVGKKGEITSSNSQGEIVFKDSCSEAHGISRALKNFRKVILGEEQANTGISKFVQRALEYRGAEL